MPLPYIHLGSEPLAAALLSTVEIDQRLNDHWTCRLVLRDTSDRRPPVEEYAGKELKITTYDVLGGEWIVFQGPVRHVELIYEVTGAYGARIEAVSATWGMAQGTRQRYFKQQTAQAVLQQVVSGAGLAMTGAMPAGENLSYVQWEETDFSFAARLVDDVEAWFRPAVDGSSGFEVQTSFQPGTTVNWREGEYGLLEWTTRGSLRPVKAEGANYDFQAMQSQLWSGADSQVATFGDSAGQMVGAAGAASGKVEAMWADRNRAATLPAMQQRLEREARRGVVSTVLCQGTSRSPQVRAGNTVEVTGLEEVNGTYGVVEVHHRWTTQGYENQFWATPWQRWSPAARPARPMLDGVYPARVVANHDPHNQGRVRVKYFWQDANDTTWVRLLTAHAGPGRGMLFYPEVGDEVLVAFEEGDAERPYVVGSAWNGVHQPPAAGFHQPGETNGSEFAANNIKRVVTKSGHRITLVDTPGMETISLATPTNNRLMLTENHKNTGRPAIVLETQGDMVLAAPQGRIHTQSLLHSREVGVKAAAASAPGKAAGTAAAASAGKAAAVSATAAMKPAACKTSWQDAVKQVNKADDLKDPLARNKDITVMYAQMYQKDPDLQWSGLASVVSRNAGCAMVKSKGVADASDQTLEAEQSQPMLDSEAGPPADIYNSLRSGSAHTAYDALGDTNQTIFRTVAPTMLFVSQHGAKQMQQCLASGSIPQRSNLNDKVANSRLDNSAVPPQLDSSIAQMASAEDLPAGSLQRAVLDKQASDGIASYEQQLVVQKRIYDGNSSLQNVMTMNQKMSQFSLGRAAGATPPEVALSADCNASNRLPFQGDINNPQDRVQYYKNLSAAFGSMSSTSRTGLVGLLSKGPAF